MTDDDGWAKHEEEVWNRVKDSYPFRPYMFRFGGNLVHKKCIENVQGGPSSSFALLLNLVGATFFAPPRSHPDAILPRGFTPTPDPQVTQSPNGVPFEKLLRNLPNEIWDTIEGYGIGRLVFVMKLSLQIRDLPPIPPEDRKQAFSVENVWLTGDFMRISVIELGGRYYIADISNLRAADDQATCRERLSRLSHFRITSHDFPLAKRNYLAVKSDGIGVVDIAIQRRSSGPEWLLNTSTSPFLAELSEAKDVDIRRLRLIVDTLKCRAVVSHSRKGAEPFFSGARPPSDAWVDSSFLARSWLTRSDTRAADTMAYFTKATYIPFSGLAGKKISLCVFNRLKFVGFDIFHPPMPYPCCKQIEVHFDRTPDRVKIITYDSVSTEFKFPQFYVNHEWLPPLPEAFEGLAHELLNETIVEDVLGLWLGETFECTPLHLGVVVSRREDLKNTVVHDVA
ncbi:hypothetical protein N7452_003294 [Penicillium brevicompactum]|uniref:Uncharacterized protein n=1 Tax=Penicillium brevicompactum TaxID=5074 RepID=A0A9W9QT74_PENBR|nr:hypothetical protein N7452_003294 [Penicillium brevicompactum]